MPRYTDKDLISYTIYLNPDEEKVLHSLIEQMDLSATRVFIHGLRLLQIFNSPNKIDLNALSGGCMGDD